MADISKINNYSVKDATARENHSALVDEINETIEAINESFEQLDQKIENSALGYTIVNGAISSDITLTPGSDKQVFDRESVEYAVREAMLHMMPLVIFKQGKSYGEDHEDYDKLVFKCTKTGEDSIVGQTGTNDYYFNLFERGFGPILVFGSNYSTLVSDIEFSMQKGEYYQVKLSVDNTIQGNSTVYLGFVMLARSTAIFNSVLHPDAETLK